MNPALAQPAEVSSPVPGDRLTPWLRDVASTYAGGKSYEIHRGSPSGVGVTVPAPSAAELDAIYGATYDYDAHALIANEKRWRSAKLVDLIARGGGPSPALARVLDVGCMYGYLLEELRRRGARTLHGIEIAPEPARQAEARGFVIHRGSIEAYAGAHTDAGFDAIFAQHVLEHVRDPLTFLKSALSLLRPGGKLVVAVPHLGARSQRLLRRSWGWYQVPVHLFHFSSGALRALLLAAGFAIEQEQTRGGDSLFLLMTLSHLLRPAASGGPGPLSALAQVVVRAASLLLRPYFYLGDEELVVVASRPA